MNNVVKNGFSSLTQLLFPESCLCCGRKELYDFGLCRTCLQGVLLDTRGGCRYCGRSFSGHSGQLYCGHCLQRKRCYQEVISILSYSDVTRKLLQRLKFRGDREVLFFVEQIINRVLSEHQLELLSKCELIVPVPLHPRRLKKRGFNQALMISTLLAKRTGAKVLRNGLKRTKNSISQSSLTRKERCLNVRNGFTVKRLEKMYPKRICLVDDIFTTGATMHECADIITKKCKVEVLAFVFARTSSRC